jgi:hypothetical protein
MSTTPPTQPSGHAGRRAPLRKRAPRRLQYWKEDDSADALRLVHAIFDNAQFAPSEKRGQRALGRAHRAETSWGPHQLVEHELASMMSQRPARSLLFAFDFLAGRPGTPRRPTSLAEFDAAVERSVRFLENEQRRNASTWLLAVPVRLPTKTRLRMRRFRVDGLAFDLVRHGHLPPQLRESLEESRVMLAVLHERDFPETPAHALTIEAPGETMLDAWAAVAPAFGLLRSVFDFATSFGRFRLGGDPTQRTRWPQPMWLGAFNFGAASSNPFNRARVDDDAERAQGIHLVVEAARPDPIDDVGEQGLRQFADFLGVFRERPPAGGMLELIADCIRLYGDAMDATRDHWALLGFWQVLERATLAADARGKTQEVESRAQWLIGPIGLPGSGYRYSLARVADKRNDLAHKGRVEDIDELDVNIAKMLAERAILKLIKKRKTLFPTVQILKAAYESRATEERDMELRIKGIDVVREVRRQEAEQRREKGREPSTKSAQR